MFNLSITSPHGLMSWLPGLIAAGGITLNQSPLPLPKALWLAQSRQLFKDGPKNSPKLGEFTLKIAEDLPPCGGIPPKPSPSFQGHYIIIHPPKPSVSIKISCLIIPPQHPDPSRSQVRSPSFLPHNKVFQADDHLGSCRGHGDHPSGKVDGKPGECGEIIKF